MNQNQTYKFWHFAIYQLNKFGEVCIPGIGKLFAEKTPARLDPIANVYLPPAKQIVFTESNKLDYIEFLNRFSKYTKINAVEAKSIYNACLDNYKLNINQDAECTIENFGTFKGKPGFIVFKPDTNLLLLKSSFGLKAIKCKTNSNQTKKIAIDKKSNEDLGDLNQVRLNALAELKQLLDSAHVTEATENKKSNKLFPIIATVLTLVLLINLFLLLNKNTLKPIQEAISQFDMSGNIGKAIQDSNLHKKSNISVSIPTTINTQNTNTDSVIAHIGSAINNKKPFTIFVEPNASDTVIEATQIIDPIIENKAENLSVEKLPAITNNKEIGSNNKIALPADVPNITAHKKEKNIAEGFYVVAGVFDFKTNAEELKSILQKRGFTNAKVLKPKNYKYNLVIYNKYNTKDEALFLQAEITANHAEAWIYEAK